MTRSGSASRRPDPTSQPGPRFPRADVLSQRGHWDEATRRVILDRVHNVPGYRHFDAHARRTLEALCARVVPQEQRPVELRIPIAPWIDERCASNDGALARANEGFRYDDMPPATEAWDRGLIGLDQAASGTFGELFADLDAGRQDTVLDSIRRGNPPGDVWASMPARRWWIAIALREIIGIYYAHPKAWDEIGFGGPAYPRGYFALNHGAREPWEAAEDPRAREADERQRRRLAQRPMAEATASAPAASVERSAER